MSNSDQCQSDETQSNILAFKKDKQTLRRFTFHNQELHSVNQFTQLELAAIRSSSTKTEDNQQVIFCIEDSTLFSKHFALP